MQSPEALKAAYEDAQNAEGSALAENEKYLSSIQGRIDLFTNSVQTMWSNFLDSDVIKFVVNLGTQIIKVADGLGLFGTIIAAVTVSKLVPWILKAATGMNTFGDSLGYLMTAMTSAKGVGSALIPTIVAQTKALWAGSASADVFALSLKTVWIAFKTLMSTPLGWFMAIGAAIALVVHVVDQLTISAKEAAEATEAAFSAYNSAQNTLKEHKKTIADIRSDYEKLADGVDALGNNISLTTEEYARYNEIANQIAEMFPEMVTGYTAEGNAIIALKGNVEELTKAYEANAQAARQQLIAKSDEIFANFKSQTSNIPFWAYSDYGAVERQEFIKQILDAYNNKDEQLLASLHDNVDLRNQVFDAAGADIWAGRSRITGNVEDWDAMKNAISALQSYSKTLSRKIKTETNSITQLVDAWLIESFDYSKMSSTTQNFVKGIIDNLDAEFYLQFKNKDDLFNYLSENIVYKISDMDDLDIVAAFDLQTKFNKGEVSVQAYEDMVSGIISLIKELGLENADSIIKSIKLVFDVDDSGAVSGNVQEVAKKLLNESDYDKIKTLTKSELDIINQNASEWAENAEWDEVTKTWKIGDPVLMSWYELKKKIEEAKSAIDDTKASDSIKSLVSIKDKLSELGGAFDQFKEDGKVSIDTISELNEKFGNIDGFEDFINILGSSTSTTEQVEQAISDMASAYLATTDILSNVTDANYDFVVSQLKALGVTNPEEYLNNLQSVHQAMADEYGVDLSNYGTVEQMKQAISSDLYSILLDLEGMTIQELASKYGDDLSHYASLEEAKTEAARREALKRQEILKNENAAAGSQTAAGRRDSQTVGHDEINTGWWIFGKNKYEGKSFSEMEALANAGDSKAKAWVDQVQSTYDNMVHESTSSAESAYKDAVDGINNATKQFNSIDDYVAQYNLKLNVNVPGLGGDKDPETKAKEEADNAFQREMDYWENQLSANQSKRDQIQNEIDLLESQGIRAGEEYYKELIALEKERKALLESQKDEALKYLRVQEIGSEEWWNAAKIVNDLEGEIDDATAALQDFADAQAQIKWDNLEEITKRLSDLHDEISDLRDILQREDMFDENGDWTESGAAVLGTYVQDLEMYKNELATLQSEIADLQAHPYNKKNATYLKEKYSIDSEQEYNDLMTQWNQQQREYVKSAYDTADAIKDLYSQQVDAIEDAINKQIDAYNDYIDVVKQAYDSERKLFEFKKDIQKQSRSIAETERKIVSLSGSTNKADIAERRKLQAQLAEQREGINSTYYDHANDQRSNALDDEAKAYEESMNRYVEDLRKTLEEQAQGLITFTETGTMVTNEFLNGVTATVMQNADVILEKYQTSGVEMSDALKQPWIDASAQLGEYGAGLSVLNDWTSDSGYFGKFKITASGQLVTPFINGAAAVSAFQGSTTTAMNTIASNVRSNVTNITSYLGSVQSAYSGIETTAKRAKAEIEAANAAAAAGAKYTGTAGNAQSTLTPQKQLDNRILSKYKLTSAQVLALGYGPLSLAEFEQLLRDYKIKYSHVFEKAQVWNTDAIERSSKYVGKNYVSGSMAVRQYYAKGTSGVNKNQLAIVDELGEELILHANEKTGRLEYLTKGSGVVPSDLTSELMELGKLGVDGLMDMNKFGTNINMISNAVNKPEFNLSVENFLRCDNVSQDSLPELKQFVKTEMNNMIKQMNYAIKGKGAR